jgi:xanthine dehydrogenase YagS FAD-binding subunit
VAEGRIVSAALAFGGVGPRPWRDGAVEQALLGKAPSAQTFAAAADALVANARGYGSNDFKIPLARRTLIACLRELTSLENGQSA